MTGPSSTKKVIAAFGIGIGVIVIACALSHRCEN
jgi:hypothetical protein